MLCSRGYEWYRPFYLILHSLTITRYVLPALETRVRICLSLTYFDTNGLCRAWLGLVTMWLRGLGRPCSALRVKTGELWDELLP